MNEYESEEALRLKVEKASRRSLTDAEWLKVAPDWSAPYTDACVAELMDAVRNKIPPRPQTPTTDTARVYRIDHRKLAALEALELVESLREELFGDKTAPFPSDLVKAAEWIEAQEQAPKTMRFSLEVTMPAQTARVDSLIWLKDLLIQHLDGLPNGDDLDDSIILKQFMKECDAIREISWGQQPLSYLGINPQGEIGIKRIGASEGTLLGRLKVAVDRIAKALDWEDYAATFHLLTGELLVPSNVLVTTHNREGKEVFGDTRIITLRISNPDAVTEQDVLEAYRRGRAGAGPLGSQQSRQRGRSSPKSERVLVLVEETPDITWEERFHEWNQRNPDDRFRTFSAMKQAYSRAIKP